MALTYAIGFVIGALLYVLILHRFARVTRSWHVVTRVLVWGFAAVVWFALVNYTQVVPRLAQRTHVLLNLDGKHR